MEQDDLAAREEWKRIVAGLRDLKSCNDSAHALASEPPDYEPLLQRARRCVADREIIEGTIYAYRDWSAQGYCDLILEKFDLDEIISVFSRLENPDENMNLGILGILSDRDEDKAAQMARTLNSPEATQLVLDAVSYCLRHDCNFWKEISLRLRHPKYCVVAARALSIGLPETTENNYPRMWRQALRCLSPSEIIQSVIFAYRNRSAHADCHRVLAQFEAADILSQFLRLEKADVEMKLGLLNFFEENHREQAIQLAVALDTPEGPSEVQEIVDYVLRRES